MNIAQKIWFRDRGCQPSSTHVIAHMFKTAGFVQSSRARPLGGPGGFGVSQTRRPEQLASEGSRRDVPALTWPLVTF